MVSDQVKTAATPPLSYAMKGRLTFSRTGWVLLAVPNAIGNGAFQALTEQGIEQPTSESNGKYNAHISVMTPDEVEAIGGPENLKQQRGQTYSFNLGPVREIPNPSGWSEMSKVWVIEVKSPELLQLRRSLGLGAPRFPFHITFAVRRKGALRKAASIIHFMKTAAQATEIKESPIDGKGLFATSDFKDGDVIVSKYMTKSPSDEEGKTRWEQSEESRFTNHSDAPNVEVIPGDGYVQLVATRDIKSGEELVGNYEHAVKVLGPDFYYTYRGKPYHGESTSQSTYGVEHPVSRSILYVLRGTSYLNDDPVGGAGADPGTGDDGEGRTDDPARADDSDGTEDAADHSSPVEEAEGAGDRRAEAADVESVVRASEGHDASLQSGRGRAEDVGDGHPGGKSAAARGNLDPLRTHPGETHLRRSGAGAAADTPGAGGGHCKMGSGLPGSGNDAGGDAGLRESFSELLQRICGDHASGSHPRTTDKLGSARRGDGCGAAGVSVLGPGLHRAVADNRRPKSAAATATAGNRTDGARGLGSVHITARGGGGVLKHAAEVKPTTLPPADESADRKQQKLEGAVNRNQDDFFSSPPNKQGRKCPGCGQLFKECEPLPDVTMCEICETFGPSTKVAADTIEAYKQFRTLASRPGKLFPLFINKSTPLPEGEWLEAENIPTEGFAPRPGWHAGALLSAPHLRSKQDRIQPNRVWAQVEMPAGVDWQSVADASPTGDVRDEVPAGGYYRKKTPQMQGGEWLIGGGLKIRKQLTDDEVSEILRRAGEHEAAKRERKTLEKEGASLAQQIAAARHKTKPPKSEAQAEAGNYPKGKVNMHGMTISLENPKGSTRSGTDPNGKTWSVVMKSEYGYILGTEGRDKDHVDVFVGPHPDVELAYVVNQVDPGTKRFDEHKVMLGYLSEAAAKKAYLENYEDGWQGLGSIVPMTMQDFKIWLKDGDTTKRAAWDDGVAGVQDMAGDDYSLHTSKRHELPEVRSTRYQGPPAVVEELFGFLQRPRTCRAATNAGEDRQRRELRTGELSLGNGGGAGKEQNDESLTDVSGTHAVCNSLGCGTRDKTGHAVHAIDLLRLVCGEGTHTGSGATGSTASEKTADVQRKDTVDDCVGQGVRVDTSLPLTPSSTRVGDGARTNHTRAKEGQLTDSFYLNAVRATPMGWNSQQSVARNLMSNLQRVKARGDRAITEAESLDRLQNAMDPNRSIRQLQSYLAGTRQPIVHHPLDRFLREGTL